MAVFGQTFQLCSNIYGIVITDAPLLSLILGASIQHQEILEGSDVYFECNIQVSRFTTWVPILRSDEKTRKSIIHF